LSAAPLTTPQTLNAANVAKLVEGLIAKAKEAKPLVDSFCKNLDQKIGVYVPAGADAHRLRTARSVQALVTNIANAESGQVISILAQASTETSEAAIAQTLDKAKVLDEAVRMASWQMFEAVASLSDQRKLAAEAIITRIIEILTADEHVIALKPALDEQQSKALKLLTDVPPPPRPMPPPPKVDPGLVVVQEAETKDLDRQRAKAVLSEINQELEKDANLRLSISWKIVRKREKL
jgi:hypothetical protein